MEVIQHWDKLVFIGTIVVWMILWRKDAQHAEERHKEQMAAILHGIESLSVKVSESIADLREQMSREHAGVTKTFAKLDEHTINEHRDIAEALTRLSTSLNHHIDDERARKNG